MCLGSLLAVASRTKIRLQSILRSRHPLVVAASSRARLKASLMFSHAPGLYSTSVIARSGPTRCFAKGGTKAISGTRCAGRMHRQTDQQAYQGNADQRGLAAHPDTTHSP